MTSTAGSHPMRRYERAESLPTLLRASIGITAGGLLAALVWQCLAPLGDLTLRPVHGLPKDTPTATSDAIFSVVTGLWGLVVGAMLLLSWRRHPEHVRNVKEAVWYWATWFAVGLLGVVTGLVLSAAAERLGGSRAPWELSTWVPLLTWPVAFNLVVALGCLLGVRRTRPTS